MDSIPLLDGDKPFTDYMNDSKPRMRNCWNKPNDSRNGHDFGSPETDYGTGFWDRDYSDEVGRGLQNACRTFGEAYLDWEELAQDETQTLGFAGISTDDTM